MRFHAGIHGISLDKNLEQIDNPKSKEKEQQEPWFRDPADYEHLPMEERKRLTRVAMARHKKDAGDLM